MAASRDDVVLQRTVRLYWSDKEIPACQAITRGGTEYHGYWFHQCRMPAMRGSSYCHGHLPDNERLERLLRKRGIRYRWVNDLRALLANRHVLDAIADSRGLPTRHLR